MKQLTFLKLAVLSTLVIIAGGFFAINEVKAAPGDVRVTVTRQGDDAALEGALVEIKCTGGSYTAFDGSPLTDPSGVVQAAPPAAAGCDVDDETINVRVSLDGYVTTNNEGGLLQGWSSGMDPNEIALTGIQFGFALIATDELNNALEVFDTLTFRGNAFALQDPVETNKFYWIDSSGDNGQLVMEKDGYVAFSTTNPLEGTLISTSNVEQVLITLGTSASCASAITTSTSCMGLQFGYKYPLIRNELATNLIGVSLSAGQGNVSCVEDGVSFGWYCPIPVLDGVPDRYIVSKDGYVGRTNFGGLAAAWRSSNADAQIVMGNITGLQFSHKFITKDELGNNLTLTSATAGASSVACAISTNTAYCPILLADDNTLSNGLIGIKTGYVTTAAADVPLAGNRTTGTNAQQVTTMTTVNGLDFTLRIDVIENEIGQDIMPTSGTPWSASAGLTVATQTYNTNKWYLAASGNGNLAFVKDGYVQANITASPTAVSQTVSTTDFIDVEFAVKATLTKQSDASALSGATVTSGDALAISCTEDGVTGIYFCAVPLAHTGVVVSASKTGFTSNTASFTDRTAASDLQQVVAFSLAVPSSGGGSPIWIFTQQVAPSPTVPVTERPAMPANDPVSRIAADAALVLAQAEPSTYFKTTGTETTFNLGSGERAAAISSFIEAYGKKPTTLNDWIDILNIANGRWPLTVNKTVEARAYVNFRFVYGHNANMKNSTDVNALKMMGYGVRGSQIRNLSTERSAISRFIKIFGFAPSSARHWNIIRAIAYSGVK